jgi:hypothetical protein
MTCLQDCLCCSSSLTAYTVACSASSSSKRASRANSHILVNVAMLKATQGKHVRDISHGIFGAAVTRPAQMRPWKHSILTKPTVRHGSSSKHEHLWHCVGMYDSGSVEGEKERWRK